MITQYSLKMPRAVFAGENSTDKLESIIAGNHLTNIAVFTDKAIRSLGLADIVTNVLDKVGVDYCILDDIPAEPSYMAVQKIIDELKAKKPILLSPAEAAPLWIPLSLQGSLSPTNTA